jgi:deaminated glutathione amidase
MTEGSLHIALAQYAPFASSAANLAALSEIVTGAAAQGAQIVIAPEYSQAFLPGQCEEWGNLAEPLEGEFVTGLAQVSADNDGVIIVAGMLQRSDNSLPTNTIVAVGPRGVVASAEKIHLYDAFGASESSFVAPGSTAEVNLLDIGGHRLGFLACYDLRFAEVTRRLVDAGATTVVVPAQWVPGEYKISHWQALLKARAIESQSYVVAAGQPAPHGIGYSTVIDPWGVVLGELDSDAGVLHAHVDASVVASVREINPVSRARRFEVRPQS